MGTVRAQDDDPPERPSIPLIGRPTTDFYNAAGTGVKVAAEAVPTELPSDQWFKFTLTITKSLNPVEVEKPSLKELPDFSVFQIDERKELDPPFDPTKPDQRVFVYKLRPNSETVERIPAIPFVYYDPRRVVAPNRPQDKFPKVLSNAVAIHVTAATPLAVPRAPIEIPAFAEQVSSCMSCEPPPIQYGFHLWPLALLAPLIAICWGLVWRWKFPNEAWLRKIRKNRAARVALAALKYADDIGSGEVVFDYLCARFGHPKMAREPSGIVNEISDWGLAPHHVDQIKTFFEAYNELRFGPTDGTSHQLAKRGRLIIFMLEEHV